MDTHAIVSSEVPPKLAGRGPLHVGVLVDLPLSPRAGGHVRCWERLAEAARKHPELLDLTIHFMGAEPEERSIGASVRYAIEPPVFSTERLRFLRGVPDHTDLAPWHARLARRLRRYDVIHTTDAYFAYARTAMRVGRKRGIPIVNSVHTNTPEYARIFSAQIVEQLFGGGLVSDLLLRHCRMAHRIEASMRAQLAAYQERCAFCFVSRPEQLDPIRERLHGRAALLRRGIDHHLFHPAKRDRAWLFQTHGIPADRVVIMCAGRLNQGKNVLLLADAIGELVQRDHNVQLLCAGEGDLRGSILRRLGERATCPGNIGDTDHLARLYASADVFAFPSRVEESANVVLEALSSGLPVLVAEESGMGRVVVPGDNGLVLPGHASMVWADTLAMLGADGACRERMGARARAHAERRVPSWEDVLLEDLLPRWQAAAGLDHALQPAAA